MIGHGATKENNALAATGHYAMGVATNYATFVQLFEEAAQSVDPAVTMPFWEGADTEQGKEFEVETWVESFVANGGDAENPLLEFIPTEMLDAPTEKDSKVEVDTDGETHAEAATMDLATQTKVSIEGRFAYFPVMDSPQPLDPNEPRGRQKYKGISVPLMVIDPAEGSEPVQPRKHEKRNVLPPIVMDHHHDFSDAHGSMVTHHHGGRSHRHANE